MSSSNENGGQKEEGKEAEQQQPSIGGKQQNEVPLRPPSNEPSKNLGFRYVWPVKIQLRQLGANGENTILHISPKFATVHDHVSFQWTLKMHGIPETKEEEDAKKEEGKEGEEEDEEEEEEESPSSAEKGYVAISLYYLDGPVNNVRLKAQVRIMGEKGAKRRDSEEVQAFLEEKNTVSVCRGQECELAFKDRANLTRCIRENIGHVLRLSLLLKMDASLFCADTYLNAVSPTPIHSFLTANYRARASSKIWRKRSTNRRPRSASDGHHGRLTGNKKLDLERTFNRVMERERERLELEKSSRRSSQRHSLNENDGEGEEVVEKPPQNDENKAANPPTLLLPPQMANKMPQSADSHLFKKLLVACCDSCERRASLIPLSLTNGSCTDDENCCEEGKVCDKNESEDKEEEVPSETEDEEEEEEEEETEQAAAASEEDIPFECDEENKVEVHDALANMYFNKVVLPDMEYVEDFVDFLIDAELNDLPVLKRACERYLCGELNTKKGLMTSLILDLFFIAMVFQLAVMKSMTLTELCERYSELEDVGELLKQEDYIKLDKRIRQLCGDRNLSDLVDECKRFREQCLRVHCVDLTQMSPQKMAAEKENGEIGKRGERKENEGEKGEKSTINGKIE